MSFFRKIVVASLSPDTQYKEYSIQYPFSDKAFLKQKQNHFKHNFCWQ